MNLAIKITLFASGIYLLLGMVIGIVKYQKMLNSPEHQAPFYIDTAHRASFLYSFAMLVVAKLLEYSPYSLNLQLTVVSVLLLFVTLTIVGYVIHGFIKTENMFSKRNFTTTWFMYLLIIGEIGSLGLIVFGFVETQFLQN
ncbi:MAG: hypothetical protein JNN15_18210 [Blastocatellia bacterium]|nr:hypothetical protein [Blastocatellia bacterium]